MESSETRREQQRRARDNHKQKRTQARSRRSEEGKATRANGAQAGGQDRGDKGDSTGRARGGRGSKEAKRTDLVREEPEHRRWQLMPGMITESQQNDPHAGNTRASQAEGRRAAAGIQTTGQKKRAREASSGVARPKRGQE